MIFTTTTLVFRQVVLVALLLISDFILVLLYILCTFKYLLNVVFFSGNTIYYTTLLYYCESYFCYYFPLLWHFLQLVVLKESIHTIKLNYVKQQTRIEMQLYRHSYIEISLRLVINQYFLNLT